MRREPVEIPAVAAAAAEWKADTNRIDQTRPLRSRECREMKEQTLQPPPLIHLFFDSLTS